MSSKSRAERPSLDRCNATRPWRMFGVLRTAVYLLRRMGALNMLRSGIAFRSIRSHCRNMSTMRTVTFARHDDVDIKLDYKLPSRSSKDAKAPILLWFHGGGES